MPTGLDIVGSVGVDVVPVVPDFHNRTKAQVLPAADRIGRDVGRRMGEAISNNLAINIPDGVVAGGRRARVAADREGGQVGGAFGRSVKRKLEEAFRSLPRADVRLGDTGINADVDRLRARIQSLSGKTIGVEIDAGAALAEIADLDARLRRLAAENPTVQVQTDTAAARAALAEVQRTINGVDRDDINVRVDVDTTGALSALRGLGVAIAGVAAIPIIPVAAAGIGSIASMALAAGAGVGALALAAVPAIKSVTSVIQAKSAAEKDASRATDNSAAANVRAAQTALQTANAQASLTSAHRQAAQQIEQANRQAEDAERALGEAAARAMNQRRQAAESVERAERSLSDAQRQARQAQDDLTAARKTAAEQLAAYDDKLADGALNQREAALRVTEAADELARVQAAHDAGTASDTDLARAQLAYDQSLQAQKEQSKSYKQLQGEAKKARKEGVDGNKDVKNAADRLSDAQRNVQDQTKAVADAQRDAARAQVEAAQSVADAQQKLSDAVKDVADVQIKAADSIASAERGVESARLSSIDTTTSAISKTDEYRQALANLTPEQRDLYDSIAGPKGLKAAFADWSKSVQPDVLPLFTNAVEGVKNALPGLTPLAKNAADGVAELQGAASTELKKPFWSGFKRDLDQSVKPAVIGFGRTLGNVIAGAAGVVDAFLPHIDGIADRMVKSSGAFADWGKGLKGSPEFEKFLDYAGEHGPLVAETVGAIAGAVISVGSALSPVSGPLLKVITGVAKGIASVADTLPWLIQLMYAVWVATKIWTIVQAALNLVLTANPLALVVVGIVALVAAVIYAYENFESFRDVVQTAWDGIQTAAQSAWEDFLQPIFQSIWDAIKWVGDAFVALNEDVIVPAATGIGNAVSDLWTIFLWPFFQGFWDATKWVGDKFAALYDDVIKPVVSNIADGASWLYEKGIKPAFDSIKTAIGLVGEAFDGARKMIKSAWDQVAGIVARPVNFVIGFVYTNGIKAVWDQVADFVGLDHLPKAPKLLDERPKFAEGGRTYGGVPGKDSIPALLMADEYVIKRSSARKIGFGALEHMNRTGEIPAFANGGLVGDAWDWTHDVFGGIGDWAKTGVDLMAHPGKVWDKLIKPTMDHVTDGVGTGPMGKVLTAIPRKMVGGLKDMLVDAVAGMFGGGGGGVGQWVKPVDVPYGTRFGVPGPMWSSGHHTGLDFPASIGTLIHAVDGGTVTGVGTDGPYGNHLEIDHGGKLVSLYAHMSSILAGLGQVVGQGDVIGKVGATGNVTGPHLHLEARVGGRAVDPMPYLESIRTGGKVSQSIAAAKNFAKSQLKYFGWDMGEWPALDRLWTGESGWRWDAKNAGSGAYGIPQALPAEKMASAGPDWRTNPATQIQWGMHYIKDRPDYGAPSVAYGKWLSRMPHWYDQGGYLPTGLSLVANGTGSPEPVFTGSQWADIRAARGAGRPITINVESTTVLDGQELKGMVDKRIEFYDGQVATSLNNGRIVI
ncbi:peptidoglycan DD-metalloendopeptidase family protein [Streptomyces sp. NPDC051132]|uniref:aggregation-promoting factor C-terminal-like domain-containing protein n=1 Tax=unclassified Streptomyces TaxID=2593676 RepID=UPI00342F8708